VFVLRQGKLVVRAIGAIGGEAWSLLCSYFTTQTLTTIGTEKSYQRDEAAG
jgi:hypothetical protein